MKHIASTLSVSYIYNEIWSCSFVNISMSPFHCLFVFSICLSKWDFSVQIEDWRTNLLTLINLQIVDMAECFHDTPMYNVLLFLSMHLQYDYRKTLKWRSQYLYAPGALSLIAIWHVGVFACLGALLTCIYLTNNYCSQ